MADYLRSNGRVYMYLTWVTLSLLKELQNDYIMLLNIQLSNFKDYTLTQVRLMCTC